MGFGIQEPAGATIIIVGGGKFNGWGGADPKHEM